MPISLPSTFYDDLDVPLSTALLNQLRAAVIRLDGLCSGRRHPVTPSSGSQNTGDAAEWHSRGDFRQSWWALRYRAGMDTLVISGECDHDLDFYINGVFDSTQAASAGFAASIDISTGYADGDIILLEIKTNGNPTGPGTTGYTPLYLIKTVWADPIDVLSAWPGVPTFAGTYDADRLNQLTDAAQYLWERVTACPIPPHVANIFIPSTHKVETTRVFDGAVARFQSAESLFIYGQVYCQNVAEYLEVYIDGVLEYTSPTYTLNQSAIVTANIALTHTIGSFVRVAIQAVVTDASNQTAPTLNSRYSFQTIRTQATTAYATAAPPAELTAGTSMSVAALNTWLNALSTMLDDAKAALDASPELWERNYAMRRVFAKDDHQVSRNLKRHSSLFQRQGDTLIVRGKGVKVAWGAITVKPPGEDQPVNYSDFSFANEMSVGADDKVQTSIIPLSTLAGLEPGMVYYVYGAGALEFAAEYIT
jgi:hypothetical protein